MMTMLSLLDMDQPSRAWTIKIGFANDNQRISKSVRSKRGDEPGMGLAAEQQA